MLNLAHYVFEPSALLVAFALGVLVGATAAWAIQRGKGG